MTERKEPPKEPTEQLLRDFARSLRIKCRNCVCCVPGSIDWCSLKRLAVPDGFFCEQYLEMEGVWDGCAEKEE